MTKIKRIVLYKHGVGYFERDAVVNGNAEVRLDFKVDQMNDVLKSLTLFDSAAGAVTSVSYDNQNPVSKLMRDSSLSLGSSVGQQAFLNSARGASVVVSVEGREIAGRIVGIDEQIDQGSGESGEAKISVRRCLSLFDDSGSLHTMSLEKVSAVRFLDEHLKKEVHHLLETLLSETQRDKKALTLFAQGEGERTLAISYVVECPVWKTSYRVALPKDDQEPPYLQGWALVDNPSDEDWSQVTLSLVSGLPVSFTHDLYSPRYTLRQEVDVEREVAARPFVTQPQLLSMAPAAPRSTCSSMADFSKIRDSASSAQNALEKLAPASIADRLKSTWMVDRVTQQVGELFEYRIEQPVTVPRNKSALVPIVGDSIEGRRKVLYDPEHRQDHPFAVLDLKNSTGLTLEGGPLTVFENDMYAGEAMLDTLSPDEERLIPYALDLIVEARVSREDEEVVVMETIKEGLWVQRKALYQKTLYRFHNKSDKPKELILEHSPALGKLVKTPPPVAQTRTSWRFSVTLPARQTTEFPVTVRSDDESSLRLDAGDPEWLLAILRSSRHSSRMQEAQREVEAIASGLGELAQQQERLRRRVAGIADTQARLRENLSRLGQSQDEARLRSRYVLQLEKQEDELAELEREAASLLAARQEHQKSLREVVDKLDFEEIFESA